MSMINTADFLFLENAKIIQFDGESIKATKLRDVKIKMIKHNYVIIDDDGKEMSFHEPDEHSKGVESDWYCGLICNDYMLFPDQESFNTFKDRLNLVTSITKKINKGFLYELSEESLRNIDVLIQ